MPNDGLFIYHIDGIFVKPQTKDLTAAVLDHLYVQPLNVP